MPRQKNPVPSYLKHRPTGQAFVKIDGKFHYLGAYGSPESRTAYGNLVGRTLRGLDPIAEPKAPSAAVLTVAEVRLAYYKWVLDRYATAKNDSKHLENIRHALCYLRPFDALPIDQFGPGCVLRLRDDLIRQDLGRSTINAAIGTIRKFAKWAVSRELAPTSVMLGLQAVESLGPGQGGRETPGQRSPVSAEVIEATLPFLPEMVAALVKVLWLTGARVGEIRGLTTAQIDRSGPVWKAILKKHKTVRFGKDRIIMFGPAAQEVIIPWLRLSEPDEPIFSPRRIEQGKQKAHGKSYASGSLAQTISRATRRAFPHPTISKIKRSRTKKLTAAQKAELKAWNDAHVWTLAQLRHTRATELREQYGIDVAATVLGHARINMTTHYSSSARKHAESAISQVG